MKRNVLLIIGFSVILSCGEMEIAWTKKIDIAGAGMYRIADIVRIDKQLYCVGTFTPDTIGTCCFVAAFDSNDMLMWHALYQDPDGHAVEGRALIVQRDQDGLFDNTYNVFVHIQAIRADSTRGSLLLKYHEGTLVWSKELDLEAGEDEQQSMMLSDHAEHLYVIGLKQTPVHGKALFITYYNIEGRFIKETETYTIDTDTIVAAIADPDNIVISGVDRSYDQLFYVRYKNSGKEINPVRIPGKGDDAVISDIWITKKGTVYILGAERNGDNGYDYVTMCYSDRDSLVWAQTFNGPAGYDDKAVALDIDDSSCVYVTGSSENERAHTEICTVKYDPSGDQVWARRFIGKKDESLRPYFFQPDDSHTSASFYLCGTAGNDVLLLKYNKSGFLRWCTRIERDASVCIPTKGVSHLIAFEVVTGEQHEAFLLKYQRAEQFGLNRWD
jgi:hypothetical protein